MINIDVGARGGVGGGGGVYLIDFIVCLFRRAHLDLII